MPKAEKKMMRRRLTGAYVSSVISISLVLVLVGIAVTLLANAGRVSRYFKESVQLSVILNPSVSEDEGALVAARLEEMPFVRTVAVVSKAQGEKELRAMLGEDFLSVFEAAPVPVSIDLGLRAEYVSADSLAKVLPVIEALDAVDEVESRQSLVDTLNRNLSEVAVVLGVFILLLLFVSLILIGNTVRLEVHSRRFTIHTMRLVGASGAFIRRPFLRSAAVQGAVSALIATGLLAGAAMAVQKSFPQLSSVFSAPMLCAVGAFLLVFGVLICAFASWRVVGRIAFSGEDDLYY